MSEAIALQFCAQYYQLFDTDRQQLGKLYRDDSQMTFEKDRRQGSANIMTKLMNLPFKTTKHATSNIEYQLIADNSMLICVSGQLKTDDDPVHSFHQTFVLKQVGDSLFIFNDIFTLVLHNL